LLKRAYRLLALWLRRASRPRRPTSGLTGTPAAFAALIAAETPKWAAVAKAAGIRIE
jgi:hypothetical protein